MEWLLKASPINNKGREMNMVERIYGGSEMNTVERIYRKHH